MPSGFGPRLSAEDHYMRQLAARLADLDEAFDQLIERHVERYRLRCSPAGELALGGGLVFLVVILVLALRRTSGSN